MDYDATGIPPVYDLGRNHGLAVVDLWMREVAKHCGQTPISRILDLGCGTGRFSNALASHFRARLIGLDASKKMLNQAHAKPTKEGVSYLCGVGERIPLRDQTIDLLFMSMVFHHFSDRFAMARECRRVLRRRGRVFIRTATVEQINAYPYVPFIPAARPLLEGRLPHQAVVVNVFEVAGFRAVATDLVVQEIAPNHAAYAEKLSTGGDSILASLSPQALADGLAAIRAHASKVGPQPVLEPIDVFVFESA